MVFRAYKSPYWTLKESEKRSIYKDKILKYLTFLDYTQLETTGKNIEAQLIEKEKEIQRLKQTDNETNDQVSVLQKEIANMKEKEIELFEMIKVMDEKTNQAKYDLSMLLQDIKSKKHH
jgi:chromosome segregation ATPase